MRLITEVDANDGRADGQIIYRIPGLVRVVLRLKLDMRFWTIRQPAVRHP